MLKSKIHKNESKIKKPPQLSHIIKNTYILEKIEKDRGISSILNYTMHKLNDTNMSNEDEEAYFKKERKNINSLFNIFKELPLK